MPRRGEKEALPLRTDSPPRRDMCLPRMSLPPGMAKKEGSPPGRIELGHKVALTQMARSKESSPRTDFPPRKVGQGASPQKGTERRVFVEKGRERGISAENKLSTEKERRDKRLIENRFSAEKGKEKRIAVKKGREKRVAVKTGRVEKVTDKKDKD